MSEKAVRWLFITVLIFLPVQYGIVGIVGVYQSEPWPAFVFPGFKSVYIFDEGHDINQTRFELTAIQGDSHYVLTPREMFPDIPQSIRPTFIRHYFSDESKISNMDAETRNYLFLRAVEKSGIEADSLHVRSLMKRFDETDADELSPDEEKTVFRTLIAPTNGE